MALRAFHNRANCWYSKKDYERAIVDYTRALEIKSNAITYNNRGSAWKNMGGIDKAKQDFHTAPLSRILKTPTATGTWASFIWIMKSIRRPPRSFPL